MAATQKRYRAEFKAKVPLEAIRGVQTLSELGARFKVHPMQIAQWKRTAIERMATVFQKGRPRGRDEEAEKQALFEQIGRLKMELDWTQEALDCWTVEAKRELVEWGHECLSQRRHQIFPYLLRGMKIERVGQLWSSDITYIRLWRGHV